MPTLRNVLIVDRLGRELEAALREERRDWTVRRLEPDAVRDADVRWADVYVGFRFPRSISEDAVATLAWAHSTGAGVDGFLEGRTWPSHVVLTRTTGAFGERIGEYCVAHALARCQRVTAYRDAQRASRWEVREARDLAGTRALVAGTGSVGRGIARGFAALRVAVTGVSRTATPGAPFERVVGLDAVAELLPRVDWLVLALPLTPDTRAAFDRRRLQHARGAHLINVARGAIAPQADVLEALERGWLGGATLDVFEREPLPADSPLWRDERVWITPHVAARTLPAEALASFLEAASALERGATPPLRVDLRLGY